MKKTLTLLFLLVTISIFAQDYTITNFDINLEITKDGHIEVEEIIDVNFNKKRRGIIRTFENKYKVNNKIAKFDIQGIKVSSHDFKVKKGKNDIAIRIGNPDIYLTGNQKYKISYIVKNGILPFPEHQEFHYDLTGTGWDTKIENVNFTITLPKSITLDKSDIKITGGRENQNLNVAEINQSSSTVISGRSTKTLDKNSGITVAVRLPKRYLEVANNEVTYFQKAKEKKEYKPWYIAFPMLLFGAFLSFWRRMRKTDFVGSKNDISIYPPEGLTSAHIGAFEDQTSHTRDIVSLLPYWASEGYLEMKQVEDEIYLYKIKNLHVDFPEYEHIIFDRLFKEKDVSKISDLQTKFYDSLSKAQSMLTSEVKLQEYYNSDYIKLFRSWALIIFPIIMIALGLFGIIYFKLIFLGIGFFIAAFAGLILPLFNLPLTTKGAKLKSEIDAFKRFLKDPDPKQLEQVLNDDPSYFDKMFPFAVAFGLEKNFLNKLEPYMHHAPTWYLSDQDNHSFSTFSTGFKPETIQSAFSSSPHTSSSGSSGGGGFSSGSGMGGGGGSSW